MDNHDGAGARSHALLQLRGINVVGIGVDVREYGLRAQGAYSTAGGDESECGRRTSSPAATPPSGAQE